MDEARLLVAGALRKNCNEPVDGFCEACGVTYTPDSADGSDKEYCPYPGHGRFSYFKCFRCDGKFSTTPSGVEHECKCVEQFRATGKIAFIDEAKDILDRAEREEREAAERRRMEEEKGRREVREERRRADEESRRLSELESRRHAKEETRRRREHERHIHAEEHERRREDFGEKLTYIWNIASPWFIIIAFVSLVVLLLWAGLGYLLLQVEAESLSIAEQAMAIALALGVAVIASSLMERFSDGFRIAVGIVAFLVSGVILEALFPVLLTGSRSFWEPVFSNSRHEKVIVVDSAQSGSTRTTKLPTKLHPLDTTKKGKYVVLRNSNVREGPGVQYKVLTEVPQMSDIDVLGRDVSSGWYQVKLSPPASSVAAVGFISGKLLTEAANCKTVTGYAEVVKEWKQYSTWHSMGATVGHRDHEYLCSESEKVARKNVKCSGSEQRNYAVLFKKDTRGSINSCRADISYECAVKEKVRNDQRVCSS